MHPLHFSDDVFKLEPLEGTIWPHSETTINVVFHPNAVGLHKKNIFCEIEGRETRLPLQLRGEARGPKARFSYDVLDIGEIYVNTPHRYEITVENIGAIDVKYSLIGQQSSVYAPKFAFNPSTGVLAVGMRNTIKIDFCCDILGDFSEEFIWELEVCYYNYNSIMLKLLHHHIS